MHSRTADWIHFVSLQCNFYLLFLKHTAHPVIIIIIWTASWLLIKCAISSSSSSLSLSTSPVHLASTLNTTIYVVYIFQWIFVAFCGYFGKRMPATFGFCRMDFVFFHSNNMVQQTFAHYDSTLLLFARMVGKGFGLLLNKNLWQIYIISFYRIFFGYNICII